MYKVSKKSAEKFFLSILLYNSIDLITTFYDTIVLSLKFYFTYFSFVTNVQNGHHLLKCIDSFFLRYLKSIVRYLFRNCFHFHIDSHFQFICIFDQTFVNVAFQVCPNREALSLGKVEPIEWHHLFQSTC